MGPSSPQRWVDPCAVEPVLRFGPAVFVASQDLLSGLMEESYSLHRRDGTAHRVVSWLLEFGLTVQRIQSHLTDSQRQHLANLLAAGGQACLLVGQTLIQEEIYRALVAAHFLCADFPALTPPGLVNRISFRLIADGSPPSLKRRNVRSD